MELMRKHTRIFCLLTLILGGGRSLAAGGDALTSDQRRQVEQLWDMAEIRTHPLEPEKFSMRKAPLYVAGANDWMSTGDGWVAGKKSALTPAAAKPTSSNEQLIVEEFFISSENSSNGPNRIYCAIARPESATGLMPVVLIFHGGGGHASGALALAAARRHPGMAGVAMDYNGQFAPGPKGKVTEWKNVQHDRKFDLVPNLRNWAMYHNVIAARRVLDFLETQPWADKNRIGAVGISYGGWVALLLAGVDDRVKCVTTGVSAGGAEFTAGRASQQLRWEPAEQRALWLANYEPYAYAARTKAAIFFQLCANDLFFWITGAAKNLEAFPGEKGWVLRPNSNHNAGGPEVSDAAAPAFMRYILVDGPAVPKIEKIEEGSNGFSYSWQVNSSRTITNAVLYWSPGKAVSPARYWIGFPAACEGDTWRVRIPTEYARLASQAFINVGDEANVVVSSSLLIRDGLDPMTAAGPQWSNGQLWDVVRGAAAWRTPAPGQAKTIFESILPTGLKLGPDKGGTKFVLISNSAILASGVAAQHRGVRLRINGNGQAGSLKVGLLRDTNSLDEQAYIAEVRYIAGNADYELPWMQFKGPVGAANQPWPFDALRLDGTRPDGSMVSVETIELFH